MADDFLQRSHLAGVEGGIPVIPTDPHFYSKENLEEVIELWKAPDVHLFDTSEQHRGEATWVTPVEQAEVNGTEAQDGAEVNGTEAEDGAEADGPVEAQGERRERVQFPCNLCGILSHRVCCALASYCSTKCQGQDWKKHKPNCNRKQTNEQINAQIDANMMQNLARPDLQGLSTASVRGILFREARQAEIAQAAQAALSNDLPAAAFAGAIEVPGEQSGAEIERSDEEMARLMQQQ